MEDNITLEKIDIIRQRTGLTYSEAKKALELNEGNVVNTLVYLETQITDIYKEKTEEFTASTEEFKKWVMDTVQKGNVTRIKIKKNDKILVDMPVNVGIVAGITSMLLPLTIVGIGVISAVATKLTVEITKVDGSVKVVNAMVKDKADEASKKINDFAGNLKSKINTKVEEMKNKQDKSNNDEDSFHDNNEDFTGYSYKLNFEEDPTESSKTNNDEEENN